MTDNDLIRRGDALRVADEVFDQCENVNGDDRGAFAAAEVGARIAALAPTDAAQAREAALLEAWNVVWEAKTLLDAKNALHTLIGEART